ncbi:efflux RND transporter periplasmic adaptor subunit [Paenibacillus humicola]|uniref:efflux RND transporter periplasmic adaptor subunit n=1 Tax=Paenibacillus humicola TaxID=3110540 RepID=UPI00237B3357|nr:efflux RND transporter periplasmic adaptor subunit [Paenibacillus humicola]
MHLTGKALRTCAAAGIAIMLLSGCSLLPKEEELLDPPSFQKKEDTYETAAVKRGNLARYIDSTATAESDRSVSVSFPDAGGQLKKLNVQEGDRVKKGDLLAELETGDLPLQIRLQKLTVEQKKLELQDTLRSGDTEAQKLAKLDLSGANLVLSSLEAQYGQALLYSPADGLVTYAASLKPGDTVEAQSTIAAIDDPSRIHLLYTTIEPDSLAPVKPGAEVTITYDKHTYQGKVVQTPATVPSNASEADKEKYAKALVIDFVGPKPAIPIGDTADIKLFVEKRDNVLIIPRSGLKNFLGRTYVQVLDKGRIKELDVESGLSTTDGVEIVQGLEEGMQVVLNG